MRDPFSTAHSPRQKIRFGLSRSWHSRRSRTTRLSYRLLAENGTPQFKPTANTWKRLLRKYVHPGRLAIATINGRNGAGRLRLTLQTGYREGPSFEDRESRALESQLDR